MSSSNDRFTPLAIAGEHDPTQNHAKLDQRSAVSTGDDVHSAISPIASAHGSDSDQFEGGREEEEQDEAAETVLVPIVDTNGLDNHLDKSSSFHSTTEVELMSVSATSSAFPESFAFSSSPLGKWIAAFSSGALYILPTRDLLSTKRDIRAFKLRRKPLTVAINDVGHCAVLWNSFHVEVYKIALETEIANTVEKLRSIQLNIDARVIAMSATGQLLAAGSLHGIELVGMTLPEGSDRRQIQSGATDSISFSRDEKSLLVTGSASRTRSSVLLTISLGFEQTMLMDEGDEPQQLPLGKLWISQLIFPEQLPARQCAFFPDPSNGQACELLAYDKQNSRFAVFDTVLKTFTDRTLNVPTDVVFERTDRYDDNLVAVSDDGARAALAVLLDEKPEIWLYEFTASWRDEDQPSSPMIPVHRLAIDREHDDTPIFLSGMRWLQAPTEDKLVLLAFIHSAPRSLPEDLISDNAPAASGRLLIFELTGTTSQGPKWHSLTINLDQYTLTDGLSDEQVEIEREIDIVRRRTQVQRATQNRHNVATRQESPVAPVRRLRRSISISSQDEQPGGGQNSDVSASRLARRRSASSVSAHSASGEAQGLGAEEPYTQGGPRPQFMLSRAATVAQHAPSSRTTLRADPTRVLEYRRADGLREIPHESDADNWVPPPPPYTEEPDQPGPNAVSLPINTIPGLAERVLQGSHVQSNPDPPANGMRSRVSQVMSGIQLPAFLPPRPVAQHHYSDSSRAPGPPPNVSIASRSSRPQSGAAYPVSSRLSRHYSTHNVRTSALFDRAPTSHPHPASSHPPHSRAVVELPARATNSSVTPILTLDTSVHPARRANGATPSSNFNPPGAQSRPVTAPATPAELSLSPIRMLQTIHSQTQSPSSASRSPTSPLVITPISHLTSADLDRPLPSLPSSRRGTRSREQLRAVSSLHDLTRPSTARAASHPHGSALEQGETPTKGQRWRAGRAPRHTRSLEPASEFHRHATSNSDQPTKKDKCSVM